MKSSDRVAFSPGEFAELFGKSQTWGYRQIYAEKVKTITEYGRILIPAAEVERILDKAGTYIGLKVKVPKKGKSLNAWRQFLADRRKSRRIGGKRAADSGARLRLHPAPSDAREAALARLTQRSATS
jgi:hypothetical protein